MQFFYGENTGMIRYGSLFLLPIIILTLLFLNCGLIDIEETPTKTKMLGLWELTEATDEDGKSIIDEINFPITAFHLSSDNGIVSTSGPMMMRVVYGDNKYTSIASKIDQVFNYTEFSFTNGEWFIEGGSPERFTLEMKLEGAPGQKSLTTLLDLLGITKEYLDVTIYHKFVDVQVEFEPFSDSTMTWTFDAETAAEYNTKDSKGEKVLWKGFSTDKFSRGTYVFEKRIGTLTSLIQNAIEN